MRPSPSENTFTPTYNTLNLHTPISVDKYMSPSRRAQYRTEIKQKNKLSKQSTTSHMSSNKKKMLKQSFRERLQTLECQVGDDNKQPSLSRQFNMLEQNAKGTVKETMKNLTNLMHHKEENKKSSYELLSQAVVSGAFQSPPDDFKKYMCFKSSVICVEGIISAGKTTLGRQISEFFNNECHIKAEFFPEHVDETLLQLFYQDPRKYAFAFQIFMLRSCMANMELAMHKARSEGIICIVDRSLWGNAVFAALQVELGNMTEPEWDVYCSMLTSRGPYKADHIIYLDVTPEASLQRIKLRGRKSESTVPIEYLKTLERHYSAKILLHLKNRTANITPFTWDNFGDIRSVLNKLKEAKDYKVDGDIYAAFCRDRPFRAKIMNTLVHQGQVNVE